LLKLDGIACNYGAIQALKGVSLEVPDGKIVALLGVNGAGKSTTLRAISGLIHPHVGQILFDNQELTFADPRKILEQGIVHCPEGRQVFPELTVKENLDIGRYLRHDKENLRRDYEKVLNYFPRLKERLSQPAGTLSGGEQQMLAIGRALMAGPKLLLLDEPSLGLAPVVTIELMKILLRINQEETSLLLVEQNARLALQISDYAYILDMGTVALHGPSEELRENPAVQALYLGHAAHLSTVAGD
jgi:branched-chain amino acid transport system ATP-binding protein